MNSTVPIRIVDSSNWLAFDNRKIILFLLFVTIALIGGISIDYVIDKPNEIPIDIPVDTDIDWTKPPCNPDDLSKDWKETTNSNTQYMRKFRYKDTNIEIAFDKGIPGRTGYKAIDHWHRYNPNSVNRHDYYLDQSGKPTGKGKDDSHIDPKCK